MTYRGKGLDVSRIGDGTVRSELDRVGAEFSDWQGRTVAVAEGRRIGGSDDLLLLMDEGGGEAIVIATQPPGDRFATWMSRNDVRLVADTAVLTGTPVGRRLTDAGFSLDRLGSRLSWKRFVDAATGEHLVVSNDALEAVADPWSEVWLAGRRRGEDRIVVGELDLEAAIAVADRLPTPGRGEETTIVGRDAAFGFLDGRGTPVPDGMESRSGVRPTERSGP